MVANKVGGSVDLPWLISFFVLNVCETDLCHIARSFVVKSQFRATWTDLAPSSKTFMKYVFFWKPGNPDFWDLEIQKFGIQKMKKK